MIRNKTLLFSLGCFDLFSIFYFDAMGKFERKLHGTKMKEQFYSY